MRPPATMFCWGDPDSAVLEPEIRAACDAINTSGWVWTSESCQGHADHSESNGLWSFPMPFIRFVVRNEDCGRLLKIIAAARPTDPFVQVHVGLPTCKHDEWVDLPVYAGIPGEDVDPKSLPARRALFTNISALVHRANMMFFRTTSSLTVLFSEEEIPTGILLAVEPYESECQTVHGRETVNYYKVHRSVGPVLTLFSSSELRFLGDPVSASEGAAEMGTWPVQPTKNQFLVGPG